MVGWAFFNPVDRRYDSSASAMEYMGVNHSGRYIGMPERFLHIRS
jgi:hypothetical protein